MQIWVGKTGFDDFQTEIFHLLKLFFEEVELLDSSTTDDGEIHALLKLEAVEANGEATVHAEFIRVQTDERWAASHTRSLLGDSAELRRRTLKRSVGFAMLLALKEATGLTQPWGILTGVRPTKLVHNLLQEFGREETLRLLHSDYLIQDEKAQLVVGIAERQLRVIPDLYHLDREISLYIGIPFCPTKCAYCTFPAYDIRGNNGSVDGFLQGLHYEIRETGRFLRENDLAITTIYWGGGTPTSIEAEQMDALFETMHEALPGMDKVRELTVEAGRPDTITEDKLAVLGKWKVDRISINPQSFTQATLDTIGRHHTVEETIEKFKLSRSMGIGNINMDLIIGLPEEGIEQLSHSLAEVEKLLPESLTIHTLSFKRASRMTQHRDEFAVAARSEVTEMMEEAQRWTERHSYVPYYMYRQKNILGNQENIGYSLEGSESIYNILMMEERQTIIGIGCGAVSKIRMQDKIERFPNPKEPSVYNESYRDYMEKKLGLLRRAYQQ